MKFLNTKLAGVLLIEPVIFEDERGFFMENYRKDLFKKNGICMDFVQDNHSGSSKGTLRGLHYQAAPKEQAKLVRVLSGEVFDVVVDLRPGSSTLGCWEGHMLSAQNKKMLFVPEGFAHGFLAMTDGTELLYKVSTVYSPEHERGLRWNDPAVGIQWPVMDKPYIFSKKDVKFPLLKEISR